MEVTAGSELAALELVVAEVAVGCELEHPAISRERTGTRIDLIADKLLMILPVVFDQAEFRQL